MDKNWLLLMSPHRRLYYSSFILLLKENKFAHNRKLIEIIYFMNAKKFNWKVGMVGQRVFPQKEIELMSFLALVLLEFDFYIYISIYIYNELLFFNFITFSWRLNFGVVVNIFISNMGNDAWRRLWTNVLLL